MRILLTGVTGFIGRSLALRLAKRHELFALVRDVRRLEPMRRVVAIRADLLAPVDSRRLPREVDAVVHLAQHHGTFPDAGRELFAVNTARTQELLDYAIHSGARQFMFASSGDVYGYRLDACAEEDVVVPQSFYAVTKHCSEMVARAYSAHLTTTMLRLFTPYGPGQTGRLIPALATRILEGKPVSLNLGNRPLLTPTFIEDVVNAFETALESQAAGTFNVSGNTVMSVRALAEELGRQLGRGPAFQETGEDVGSLIGDNSHMKSVLGIAPVTDLHDGLNRTFSTLRR
jgi:nucleoside-diphosphate-sugar epimerase